MNRCTCTSFRSLALTTWLLAGSALSTHAQDIDPLLMPARQLPKAALLGRMVVQQPPVILLNGQTAQLSPGARIRNADNTLAMSGTLIGQALPVKYLLDSTGLVQQVWILTDIEVRASRKSFSLSNFLFGSGGATGPVDDGKTPFDQLPRFPNQ
ncbi:MAG: hypothetical protein H7224_00370 [Polaromonas sp.]|nr:hypothetical protein [Polaromonas sp.]